MSRSAKDPAAERGPLILGAGGRIGWMFRRLAAQGLWPGPEPLWHTRDGRDGTLGWEMAESPPTSLAAASGRGLVVLAGATAGSLDELLAANQRTALAALDLAARADLTPVLLCSSAAVYGHERGPRAESERVHPASAYGAAKESMEVTVAREAAEGVRACVLRIGNVAGGDALFGAMAQGPVTLDRLRDGTSPRRAYVGPLTLARALVALIAQPLLPPILNLAQPRLVAMDDLLRAAGHPFAWRPAPPTALPALEMDLSRLLSLVPLPPATPEGLVAEARLAGWRPFGEAP